MMKLLSLEAQNIFSLGHVKLDLADRGLTLVTGWSFDDNNGNMAGKSSLTSRAIVWCLYGKTVDGVRADAVINTSTDGKPCCAEIYFEDIDGTWYYIRRSRNPNTLKFKQSLSPPVGGVANWIELSKRNEKETQELINKALGRDHKTFIQSDFFGQGRERSFLSLAGSEQRAVVEEILPLTSLDRWQENAKEHLAEAELNVTDTILEIKLAGERINALNTKVEEIGAQHNSWGHEWLRDISASKSRLKALQGSTAAIEREYASLLVSLPEGISVSDHLENQNTITTDLAIITERWQGKIDRLTEQIWALEGQPDTCTTCNQKLPEDLLFL